MTKAAFLQAMRWAGFKSKPTQMLAVYIPPEKIPVQLIVGPDDRKEVWQIKIGGDEIIVPDKYREKFYEIIKSGLVDKKGFLKDAPGINVRIRHSHKDGKDVKYKFAIKADPSEKKLEKLFEGYYGKQRKAIEKEAKIKSEWQFEFNDIDGLFPKYKNHTDTNWIEKQRWKLVESGAVIVEEVIATSEIGNIRDKIEDGLYFADYESYYDRGVWQLKPSWLQNAPNAKDLGSRALSEATQAKLDKALAAIKKQNKERN